MPGCPRSPFRTKTVLVPLILIALGILILLANFGLLPPLGPLFTRWWPMVLVVVGIFLLLRRI
ncbi:MAG: DUF5668 domain-containing protein [Burkholderiaceae bacterium]